jgi:phosphatidylglycerophosphatase A
LAILPLVWLALQLSPLWALAIFMVLVVVGVWCCGVTAKALGVHDDGRIVFDEFAGQYLTFAPLVLWGTHFVAHSTLFWLASGFVFFRLFDVLKPTPIRQLDERVHGGFGIMLDDLLAGVFAAAALWLLALWL